MRSNVVFTALLFSIFCVNVYGIQVSIPELSAEPGSTIAVGISVDDATGIAGGNIKLEYDPAILAAKGAQVTDLAEGLSLIANIGEAGKVTLSMAGTSGLPGGSGALVKAAFEVSADASGKSLLILSDVAFYDEMGSDIDVTTVDGSVTVQHEPRLLSISDTAGRSGEKIVATISIDDLTGVAGADLALKYDPAFLSVEEVRSTNLLAGMSIIVNADVEGKVVISMAATTGAEAATGTIFDISFEVRARVSGETELAFESVRLYDENGSVIPVQAESIGKITIEPPGPPVIKEHTPGSPVLALQATYDEANTHGHTYIDIWEGSIPIEAGMFLEFQVAMFSGNPTFRGAVDLHTSDGSTLRDSGATDQNSVSAHPSADLSKYARDQWYHRKISLDVLAGKTLDGVMIATDSNEHLAGVFRVYVANIQITDGEYILEFIWGDESSKDAIPITGTNIATETSLAGTEGISDYSVSIVGATPITSAGKLISPWGSIKR